MNVIGVYPKQILCKQYSNKQKCSISILNLYEYFFQLPQA